MNPEELTWEVTGLQRGKGYYGRCFSYNGGTPGPWTLTNPPYMVVDVYDSRVKST